MTTYSGSFPVFPSLLPLYLSILAELHGARTTALEESEIGRLVLAAGDEALGEIERLIEMARAHTERRPITARQNQMDYGLVMAIKASIERRSGDADLSDDEREALERLGRALSGPGLSSISSFSAGS